MESWSLSLQRIEKRNALVLVVSEKVGKGPRIMETESKEDGKG